MKRLLLLLPFVIAGTPALAFWGEKEPWATPKGDARTDCAVYKTKNKRHDDAQAREKLASNRALEKHAILSLTKTEEEVDEWWFSDKNPLHEISKKEREAYVELQLAQINVVKHLGYSKQRLKEMWEYRSANGKKWKAVIENGEDLGILWEKSWDGDEITAFCKNF